MYIDLSELGPDAVYFQMIQTLIPRPIAWVLSENEGGNLNLAPFSYFNAVCSDPPLIMLSIGRKPDGRNKDTRVNIEQRGHFVIHIPHREQARVLTQTSATRAAGVSELEEVGLETVHFEGFSLPRLAECRIAYACERHEIREIGGTPQSLILGRVRHIHVDDGVTVRDGKGRLKVDAAKVDPLGRLGASEYVSFGEVIRVPRPA
jgi:flavin reductase (DIM6/NTAB) family NADH-FMN oxidoreductase RutF